MKFTILVDNKTENTACEAEWGLSLLIETNDKKILFDAGASEMFINNAERLKVNLEDVDCCVISHGHYDHTGGIPQFLKINTLAKVYLHQNALKAYYNVEGEAVGIRWPSEFVKENEDRFVLTNGKTNLFNNVTILANIIRKADSVATENFYYKDGEDYCLDDMSHEQVLVIEEDNKLYVFSGCSHIGVLSILDCVKENYPDKPIEAFVAGMHLFDYQGEGLDKIIEEMANREVSYFVPLHCTGMNAIVKMKEKFKDNCIIACSGDVVVL